MVKKATESTQVIMATQSPRLLVILHMVLFQHIQIGSYISPVAHQRSVIVYIGGIPDMRFCGCIVKLECLTAGCSGFYGKKGNGEYTGDYGDTVSQTAGQF